MCGLATHAARSLICNGELDILGLVHRFSDAGDRSNHYWQGFRQHALCLCLLSHILLSSGFGGASIRLIEVAQGLREGKSCIAMTLAETLMGLDSVYRRETTIFAGNPLLLQVMFPTQPYLCICSHHSTLKLVFFFFFTKPLSYFFSHRTSLCSLFSHFPSLPQVWLMDKL